MPTDTAANDFDIHDLEALQMLINHGSHALGERIIALEQALEAKTAAHHQAITDRDEVVQQLKDLRDRLEAATT